MARPAWPAPIDGDLEAIVRAVLDLVCHVGASPPASVAYPVDCPVSETICPERLP